MLLCSSCRCVVASTRDRCGSCDPAFLIPYIDRRPLFLERAVRDKIVDLIDTAVENIGDDDLDLHLFYEFLPFLQRVMEEAERAEAMRTMGTSGFRTTSLSVDEVISYLREMRLPPVEAS